MRVSGSAAVRMRVQPQSVGQSLPYRLAKRGTAVLFDVIVYHPGETVVIPVAAGETHQGEGGWQQAAVGQVVDGRHYLFVGQVPGDAEKHHGTRAGDSGQPLIFFVPQWITPLRGISARAHLAAEPSCFCVSLSSSVQASTNFSTPSFSSTTNTSDKSIPTAASLSNTSWAAEAVPLIVSPLMTP